MKIFNLKGKSPKEEHRNQENVCEESLKEESLNEENPNEENFNEELPEETEISETIEEITEVNEEEGKAKKTKLGDKFSFLKKFKINVNIKTKLIFSSLLPVLFIIILGISSYNKAAGAIVESYETSTQNAILKASEYYSLMFTNMEKTSLNYYTNDDVIKYYSGYYKKSAANETKLYMEFYNDIIAEAKENEFISGIHIISNYGDSVSTKGKIKGGLLENFLVTEEGKKIVEQNGNTIWLGQHPYIDEALKTTNSEYGISVNRTIKSTNKSDVAILTMDIAREVLVKPIESMQLPKGSYCAVVTPDGREITIDEFKGVNTFFDKEFYQQALSTEEALGSTMVKDAGGKYLMIHAKIGDTGNVIACMIPQKEIMAKADEIKLFTMIIVIIASIIAIAVSFFIATGISFAIKKISKVTEKAAEGDLTGVVNTRSKDELGKLANHTTTMLNDMKGLIGHVAGVTDLVHDSAENVAHNSEHIVEIAKQISEAVENIEVGVNSQSQDAQNCKDKMNGLSEVIGVVVENTTLIEKNSEDTRNILTVGVKRIDELSENVEQTTKIAQEAIDDMEALNKESKKINSITNAINEIAEQTNLLALNASIEAARAGAAGRGFSVVAEEIRKLAEQSVDASSQINSIVQSIQKNMNSTVGTIKGVGEIVKSQEVSLKATIDAFDSINQQMDSLNNNINVITSTVQVMNDTKDDTMEAIENISVVLEETAAASTEVLASVCGQVEVIENFNEEVKNMQENSMMLQDSISIFKI